MTIDGEARARADGVLNYFENLERLGEFSGLPVTDQKRAFLVMTLLNFAKEANKMEKTDHEKDCNTQGGDTV